MANKKLHLVLSSGGVLCFSYIGAYRKLKEQGYEIASVSACSMGTILGVLLCSGKSPEEIEKVVLDFDFSLLRTKKRFALLQQLRYPHASHHIPDFPAIITRLIGGDLTLKELPIPLSIAALDIRQNQFLVYATDSHPDMRISEVVRIATAIPLMYEPFKLDGRLLVDAAVACESPVWMAAGKPDSYPIVILKPEKPKSFTTKKSLPAFIGRLFSAATGSHDQYALTQTPRTVEVNINCGTLSYDNFNITQEEIEGLVQEGYAEMTRKLKDYNYNFNRVMEVELIRSKGPGDAAMDKVANANSAASLAQKMMTDSQNAGLQRNQVFISYCHEDKEWLEDLQVHLSAFQRFTGLKVWDDTNIKPGDEWNTEIRKALIATKVAVFLVTPEFLASEFIQEQEMKYFLDISKAERVPILWVAVKPSAYRDTPLNTIQCANDPGMPLSKLQEEGSDLDGKWVSICEAISTAMKS